MMPLEFKPLSSFTQRRLIRLVGMIAVIAGFAFLQIWQIEERPQPPGAPVTTSTSVNLYYSGSTTSSVEALVSRVVDGDTIEVKIDGMSEAVKVRLLGMNTPESVDPRRPVQCFGKEASNHMKELVEGRQVLLLEDPKADDRDKYGRWLRNIVRKEDLLDVNATLVAQGYANAYLSFPLDGKRKAQLRLLEQEAKAAERGLWSPSTCEGKK
jgi:micrococcal nuclease